MCVHVDPNSKPGKFILVLGIPLFSALLLYEVYTATRAARSLFWDSLGGVVVEAKIEDVYTQHGKHETAKIKYAYTVRGTRYENDVISFGLFRGILTWGHARRLIARYPVGRPVTVFYDDQSPDVSCLEPGEFGIEDVGVCILAIVGLRARFNQARRSLRGTPSFPTGQRLGSGVRP
jgi:hypothetical protein